MKDRTLHPLLRKEKELMQIRCDTSTKQSAPVNMMFVSVHVCDTLVS